MWVPVVEVPLGELELGVVFAERVEEMGAEAEAGGVAEVRRVLFEARRDGIVIEPEEEESDGDPIDRKSVV